ncbi:MAG: hypothetical protein Q4A07_09310 [Coriobacteriales bacterium]|nr:hypothetical protein [Coriobacteriales bacterium]
MNTESNIVLLSILFLSRLTIRSMPIANALIDVFFQYMVRALVPRNHATQRYMNSVLEAQPTFDPLSEREMLEELLLFVENLTCDCYFNTHHTVSGRNLSGPNFLTRKEAIATLLRHEIDHGDLGRMAHIRANKATL